MRVTSGGRVCVIGFHQDTPVIVDQRSETQRSCGSSALRRGHPALDDFALCSVCGAPMCATAVLPFRKSSQCVRWWWNRCVCVMCTPVDDELLCLASWLDVVPLTRPAAGLARYSLIAVALEASGLQ